MSSSLIKVTNINNMYKIGTVVRYKTKSFSGKDPLPHTDLIIVGYRKVDREYWALVYNIKEGHEDFCLGLVDENNNTVVVNREQYPLRNAFYYVPLKYITEIDSKRISYFTIKNIRNGT